MGRQQQDVSLLLAYKGSKVICFALNTHPQTHATVEIAATNVRVAK